MKIKKKLVLFYSYSIDEAFRKKFDIKNAKKFFNIKIVDLSKIYNNYNKFSNYYPENNLNNLKKLLLNFKPDIGVMYSYDTFHKKIALFCKNTISIRMLHVNTWLIPENMIIRPKGIYLDLLISKNFFSYLFYIFKKIFNLFFSKKEKIVNYNFDYSVVSGTPGKYIKNVGRYKENVENSKKQIYICSSDYKRSFKFKIKKKNYAVFVDEDLFFHRDYERRYKGKKFVTKKYFKEMNNFFKFIEKKFELNIIIALHPKCEKKKEIKKLFNNRKCFIDKTHKLVSECKYVFVHPSTTSIGIPVIFKKPIIFLTTNELMKNLEWRMRLERRKFLLNQPFINISNNEFDNFKLSENFDRKGYNNYIDLFIKSCNRKVCDKSYWEDLNLSIFGKNR